MRRRRSDPVMAVTDPQLHLSLLVISGTVPELRRTGPLGLLFVDGHEDTMPLDVS